MLYVKYGNRIMEPTLPKSPRAYPPYEKEGGGIHATTKGNIMNASAFSS